MAEVGIGTSASSVIMRYSATDERVTVGGSDQVRVGRRLKPSWVWLMSRMEFVGVSTI